MTRSILFFFALFLSVTACAQPDFYQSDSYIFTEADTLRGMLRPERTCYDVTFYDLNIKIEPERQFIGGYVEIRFDALEDFSRLQIDLYENMKILRIEQEGKPLNYERKFNAVFVDFPPLKKGSVNRFRVYYEGAPVVAQNPPWDGGFVWARDEKNRPWIGVACEGAGASLWWPNKDHLSDEPDSMSIRVSVPNDLFCVANGNLRNKVEQGDFTRYDWLVSYPINNYNVSVNIAHYGHFADTYTSADGDQLPLDYYVLDYNVEKARKHFEQVKPMLACYEQYVGKYPFWNDGFAMVETPYLGMEHQGAIAYGNHYMRGYLGGMIPKGMDWDYIIIHETGHEYYGNSISCNDLAEMWIHESFTTYLESVYVECRYSYEDALQYLRMQRFGIANREPIIGPKGVNWENWESGDHYNKGAWMLHTLRHAIGNDNLWWDIFKGFYQAHVRSNINSEDFFNYVNQKTGEDWTPFFDQYLRYPGIPTLEYELKEKGKDLTVRYHWIADVPGFNMPVLVGDRANLTRLQPKAEWQETTIKGLQAKDFEVATDRFYIRTKRS